MGKKFFGVIAFAAIAVAAGWELSAEQTGSGIIGFGTC